MVVNEGDDFIATKADHVLYVPRGIRAVDTGADRDPTATAGLPHRCPPRRGCGWQLWNLAKSVTVE